MIRLLGVEMRPCSWSMGPPSLKVTVPLPNGILGRLVEACRDGSPLEVVARLPNARPLVTLALDGKWTCYHEATIIGLEVRATVGERVDATIEFDLGATTLLIDSYPPMLARRPLTWDDVVAHSRESSTEFAGSACRDLVVGLTGRNASGSLTFQGEPLATAGFPSADRLSFEFGDCALDVGAVSYDSMSIDAVAGMVTATMGWKAVEWPCHGGRQYAVAGWDS